MKNILLICAGGMSTSILMTKMKECANQHGIDVKIWAISAIKAKEEIPKADVVLLGPQIRYLYDNLVEIAKETPLSVIDPKDYGTMDGAKVLHQALQTILKKNRGVK